MSRTQTISVFESSRERAKFYVECGRLLRRPVRRVIEKTAIALGVEINWREDKGLIDSVFYVEARGDGAGKYAESVMSWVNENLKDKRA